MNMRTLASAVYPILGISVCASLSPLLAQQIEFESTDISQIADEVLEELLPADRRVSRVAVGRRGIFFDHQRTIDAFGLAGTVLVSAVQRGVRRSVQDATETILEDCQWGPRGTCSRIGWGVYVWIDPRALTASTAAVSVTVLWPDRGSVPFEEGVPPQGEASLVGFAADVHLARDSNGDWQYVNRGLTHVF